MPQKREWNIISVGGSLVAPDGIDVQFLSGLRDCLLPRLQAGKGFVLTVGGGRITRQYQEAAGTLGVTSSVDKDWIGIYATRLNAMLLRTIFIDVVYEHILTDHGVLPATEKRMYIAGGSTPGWSTDYNAVMLAKAAEASRVINISNIDHVYNDDPRKNPSARSFDILSWSEYRALIPQEWSPGLNSPFDPIAAKIAQEGRIEAVIMNGKDLSQLGACLDGRPFVGTRITP